MGETIVKVIKAVTAILVSILGLQIILKLLGALPTVIVFKWIYDLADIIKSPFVGVLESITFGTRFTLDLSAIFAAIAYIILAAILIWLLKYISTGGKH